MKAIPYILAVMIFWDWSLHVIELLGKAGNFTNSRSFLSYYYPHFRKKKTPKGPVERAGWEQLYQRFWVSYWGLALVLIGIYIIFR